MKSIILFFFLVSCHSAIAQKTDKGLYAVFPYDSIRNEIPFDDYAGSATLDQNEIDEIHHLFFDCVKDYNNKVDTTSKYYREAIAIDPKNKDDFYLDPTRYFLQIVPYLDRYGNKIVWVNCTCCGQQGPESERRKYISITMDGGNCYLNFKINLTTKKYYDLYVNGDA